MSITWNSAFGVWLMLYNCGPPKDAQILARVASAPWGPWSRATLLLDPTIDNNVCQLMMKMPANSNGCDGRPDEWGGADLGKINGGFYAPFVMERYTTRLRSVGAYRRAAMVYWLLSTYNPYQVFVMWTALTVEAFPTSANAETKSRALNP